jgi:tetratricopeptide (TPR) repeat protein
MKAVKLIIILLLAFAFNVSGISRPAQFSTAVKIKFNQKSQKDTAAVNDLIRKGIKYLSTKPLMVERVSECIDSAFSICEKEKIEVPARLNSLRANYYYASGDLSSVSDEAELALKKAKESNDFETLAKTHILLGLYYYRTGFYRESIENYEAAIEVAKKANLKEIIPSAYYRQADVYRSVGDTKQYLENIEMMIDAGFTGKDSSYAQLGLHILGTYFCGDTITSERRNFKLADSLLRRSLSIAMPRKDTSSIVLSMANLGWNFYLELMYDSAVYYYNKTLKYSIPAGLSSAAANCFGNLGTIYRDKGENKEALKYYQQGIEQAKKDNDLYNLWWIYRDMSDLYLWSKDTTNAFRNYVLFKKYSDQYNNKATKQGLADAQIRYEADTHKKELELLSLRLKNNRLLNYGFAGLTILILAIGYLIYRGSKLKDKRRISEMNRKISEITQANLRQQMNPHFIFNTLNSIQYYMYQHDKLATNNYLTKFSSLMRKVLENSQHTSVPLSDELSALNLYLELESIRFKDKFEYNINIDEDIDPLMHKIPTMLIQP